MRTPLLIIACFTAVLLQLHGQERPLKVGESTPLPKDGFANLEELQKWASSSSFGGGRSGIFNLGGTKVVYTDRCFTSGMSTSELTFYIQRVDGRIAKFFGLPMELREHRVEQRGEKIIITTWTPKGWLEVMSISSAMFTALPFKIEQEAALTNPLPPATAPESKAEGRDKPKSESEGRSQ